MLFFDYVFDIAALLALIAATLAMFGIVLCLFSK